MTTNPTKPLTARQIAALTANLNPARVNKKPGGNLSYLEAYDIKATLIKVFGFGGWSSELIESQEMFREQVPQASNPSKMNWKVAMKATVRLTIHQTGAVYTEAAIAGSAQPDYTESADMALKSAESDALKRAAIMLGTQFGLSLYNNGSMVDVVKVVLSPGQEWPALNPDQKAQEALAAQRELEYIGAIIDGVDPAKAKEEIWGAPQPTPNAVARPVTQVPPDSAQTPEQYAASQELVKRALTMKAQQAAAQEQAAGVDYAALAQQDQGQAAVLAEPDYSAESEAYAAADGHHE